MDKVLLFDVFDFVSFHICKSLLNKGIEVKGIHAAGLFADPFHEQKRDEIGRNANFEEINLDSNTDIEKLRGNGTFIISFYDIYMLHKESLLEKIPLGSLLENCGEAKTKFVFLLPVQMISGTNHSVKKEMDKFINDVKGISNQVKCIYLPALYGTWQPATFLFQQSILARLKIPFKQKDIRESTIDAVFIDDAMDSLIQVINDSQPGKYVLISGKQNQWEKCAAFLNIDNHAQNEPCALSEDIIKVIPKRLTKISESLEKQTQHTRFLLEERDFK
jgi:hypothetical protein